MKRKQIYSATCVLAASAMMGLSFPATVTASQINPPAIEVRGEKRDINKKDMEKKREKMQKNWESLTDAQRDEIYKLKDVSFETQMQIIDKYLEFGIIDAEAAGHIKEKMTAGKQKMRTENKMPFFGGKK